MANQLETAEINAIETLYQSGHSRRQIAEPGNETMNATLTDSLTKLGLSGLSQSLEIRLQEAASNRLDHAEFLEPTLDDMGMKQLPKRSEESVVPATTALGESWSPPAGYVPDVRQHRMFTT